MSLEASEQDNARKPTVEQEASMPDATAAQPSGQGIAAIDTTKPDSSQSQPHLTPTQSVNKQQQALFTLSSDSSCDADQIPSKIRTDNIADDNDPTRAESAPVKAHVKTLVEPPVKIPLEPPVDTPIETPVAKDLKTDTAIIDDPEEEKLAKVKPTPFDMVKCNLTYLQWLEVEARKFNARYFQEPNHPRQYHKYSIMRVLGEGGFGLVLLVSIEKRHPLYAMKVMSKERIKEKKMIKYIIGERRALSSVNHPLIVPLIDTLKDNSNVYIVMPFIECGDLFRLMQSTRLKRFSYNDGKFYISQVLLAFEYLHKMRVLYRDLKPENLMLDRDGYIQLADLGFAKLLDVNRERTYSTLGTPDYMAPEIFSAKNCGYSFSVDYWTIGCLLFEFLVGFPPFYTPSGNMLHIVKKIMSTEIPFPNFIQPDARELISSLCQKNPYKRIGCQKTGPMAVREHEFFNGVDFVRLFQKQIVSPHRPSSKDNKAFYSGRPVPKNAIRISKNMRYKTMFAEF